MKSKENEVDLFAKIPESTKRKLDNFFVKHKRKHFKSLKQAVDFALNIGIDIGDPELSNKK